MNKGQYVFTQLVSHLDRNHFNYLARKYDGNKYLEYVLMINVLLLIFQKRKQKHLNYLINFLIIWQKKNKMSIWKKLKIQLTTIPTLLILGMFGIVVVILKVIAKIFHLTYNEVNIIVYYLLIPLSWCVMLDTIIHFSIFTPLWILLWIYIFWSKRKFYHQWCDVIPFIFPSIQIM